MNLNMIEKKRMEQVKKRHVNMTGDGSRKRGKHIAINDEE
jgi:hypothetical protein